MTHAFNGNNDDLPPTADHMTQRPKPTVRAKTFFLYSPTVITPHCGHAVLGGDQEYPYTGVSSRKRMVQAPKCTIYLNLDPKPIIRGIPLQLTLSNRSTLAPSIPF